MLESYLSDFAFIRETLDKEGEHHFFDRNFSFFSGEPVVLYHSDKDVIIYVNRRFAEEFHYTVEDLSKWKYSIYPMLSDEDKELFRTAIKTVQQGIEGESTEADYRLIPKDQSASLYRLKARKLYKSCYVIQFERRSQVAKPAESMQSLTDYKDMMQKNEIFLKYGTWESDPSGENISWTDGMYAIFGYGDDDRASLRVNADLYRKHMNRDEDRRNPAEVAKFLVNKHEYHIEFQIRDKNGIHKILSTYAKIIRDAHDKIERIIGTTRDVTEIREKERMLEDKIGQLNRSNKELEEFAYIASHDLQEPLRKISTFIQRLQNKLSDVMDDDSKLFISRIQGSADNMRNLIDNLLEFSRISRSSHPFEKTDLSAIVATVISEMELSIEESQAILEVDTLPVIDAIPSQMLQVFHNLFNNAIKFRRKDVAPVISVKMGEVTHEEKQQQQLAVSKEYYKIIVADNGIGFDEAYSEKIFQLFQRLHGKYEYPGTGIGLSICKKIVTSHGGQLYATSTPGEGSSFFIILPKSS